MDKSLELFEKRGGRWEALSMASFTGNQIRKEVWASMDGKEIVGKLTQQGRITGYIAGTEELRTYYAGKTDTKVWSWTEAAEKMEQVGSALVGEGWEHYDRICAEMLKVFGEGCRVELIKFNGGEYRYAEVSKVQE